MWLILVVILGIFVGRFAHYPIPSNLSWVVLMFLIFFAGVNIGAEENVLKKLSKTIKRSIILVILTILGTYLGAVIISFFIPISLKESVLAASGFGWYSLSAIMISNLYSPYLASISFIANVLRESMGIIFIPLVSKFSPYGAISMGGSPSMDTLLGIVAKSNDRETTLISFGHGVILSLITPFIISLIFSLLFR